MAVQVRHLWRHFTRPTRAESTTVDTPVALVAPTPVATPDFDIAPNDPAIAYFQAATGAVDLDRLALDSPAIRSMKAAGVRMVVPLVSQGELIGLLNLGPRLSQQEYSTDDRALLANLAAQTAPALRVAQLVRAQQIEARDRERIDQELRVARLIQQTLLPRQLPELDGWHMTARYQPAREVGGDFYDFLPLPFNRLGIIVGDVTDKGVPAALVMSSTRSLLRTAGLRSDSPGEVLERVNELLVPDIPESMFVTCLYAILDPATGLVRYANAGHDLPYRQRGGEVAELRATGMPLGLMLGMRYEENETILEPGDRLLFYSDGLVEAHDPARQMFGFPRLRSLLAGGLADDDQPLVDALLSQLANFTGPDWEQEDDITLVTVERARSAPSAEPDLPATDEPRPIAAFELASEPGAERAAMERVATAIEPLGLPARQVARLKTAVAEATMNAIEHGNQNQADVPVRIAVLASARDLIVRISDRGGGPTTIAVETPDLEAKLDGEQSPRGWGLFLIKNLVDDLRVTSDGADHTIELIVHREGEPHAGE